MRKTINVGVVEHIAISQLTKKKVRPKGNALSVHLLAYTHISDFYKMIPTPPLTKIQSTRQTFPTGKTFVIPPSQGRTISKTPPPVDTLTACLVSIFSLILNRCYADEGMKVQAKRTFKNYYFPHHIPVNPHL